MKTFVINLDNNICNYDNQLKYLAAVGLDVRRFSGINGNNDDHLQYQSYISPTTLAIIPKSVIGCALSHILLSKMISEKYTDPYYLILEDDAYPLDSKDVFQENLKRTLNEVNVIDAGWEIIALHTDGLTCEYSLPDIFKCKKSNYVSLFSGSAAAYLISAAGVAKLGNIKVPKNHIDIHFNTTFKKYKSKDNMFYTDETMSVNRCFSDNFSIRLKSNILARMIKLKGEKPWKVVLNVKVIKIKNHELTINNIFDIILILTIVVLLVLFIKNKYYK